jgi:hypothetical protein
VSSAIARRAGQTLFPNANDTITIQDAPINLFVFCVAFATLNFIE